MRKTTLIAAILLTLTLPPLPALAGRVGNGPPTSPAPTPTVPLPPCPGTWIDGLGCVRVIGL